jgi:hypothetical protein
VRDKQHKNTYYPLHDSAFTFGANARLPPEIKTSPHSHSTNFRSIALPSLLV